MGPESRGARVRRGPVNTLILLEWNDSCKQLTVYGAVLSLYSMTDSSYAEGTEEHPLVRKNVGLSHSNVPYFANSLHFLLNALTN